MGAIGGLPDFPKESPMNQPPQGSATRHRCQVAILGYGPVGATLANQLGAAGIDVVVIERDTAVFPLPRAIHFDGETMRIFQGLGLRGQAEEISRPGLKGMHFLNARGEVLLVRGGTGLEGPQGGANNHYFHQPELEAVLRKGVTRHPSVRVLSGVEASDLDVRDDGVTLTLTDPNGQAAGTVSADWLVGCDGGRSMVRRAIGAPTEDLGLHQPWLVFDVILDREIDLPDYTIQWCDPARPMTLCCITGQRRRWEIMLMPGDDQEAMARPENVWPLIERWVSPADGRLERSAIYTFHSVIAGGWRKGRLLIAGDAAHQTPPFLGQGLCAGVRDAANLWWKLERVVRGTAHESLLDTYESERRPHVRAFIDLAVRLGDIIQTTDPVEATERDRRFLAGEARVFEFPAPGLGPGLHLGPLGGTLFPQPRLADGRRLDELVGNDFALIGRSAVLESADADTRLRWRSARVCCVEADEGALAAWLDQHGASAVIVRPDRYLLGGARDGAELAELSRLLPCARP
jgi:3-(3-hydroxy-phenyl)propionate hydroxylase